ncbi:hypothetical protein Pint_16015 [Pistacia integerrima]|uniref:Uncharacterized protein n=1 Tax=Pistacia integerrima TaxID=434235 RepID=A0ACC0ZB55_9ROSI|nr:hypothetical protein Pint_16015 [Pistacia integerrima]
MGIKDLFQKHPGELRLHRYAAIEKLRECISDDDKVLREMLYQLFKTVIFPGCKEETLHFSFLFELSNLVRSLLSHNFKVYIFLQLSFKS